MTDQAGAKSPGRVDTELADQAGAKSPDRVDTDHETGLLTKSAVVSKESPSKIGGGVGDLF